MRLRRGLLVLGGAAVLAACSAEPGSQAKAGEDAERIACALAGAADFAQDCVVERAPKGPALFLVVRHPDGAFRRFEVLQDGRGLAVADGAEPAQVVLAGDLLEVTVDKDRYRFPATQKAP